MTLRIVLVSVFLLYAASFLTGWRLAKTARVGLDWLVRTRRRLTDHLGVLGWVTTLLACGDDPGRSTPSSFTPAFGPAAIASDGVTFIVGDGRRFSCSVEISGWDLPEGSSVPLEIDDFMDFAGQVRGPLPSIFLNLVSLERTPVAGQIFIFVHECGHVNHSGDILSEVAANCWAARRLSAERVLSESEWEVVHQMLLSAYPFSRGPYPSGLDQWAQLQSCR